MVCMGRMRLVNLVAQSAEEVLLIDVVEPGGTTSMMSEVNCRLTQSRLLVAYSYPTWEYDMVGYHLIKFDV